MASKASSNAENLTKAVTEQAKDVTTGGGGGGGGGGFDKVTAVAGLLLWAGFLGM
jgi:hypothetical protein